MDNIYTKNYLPTYGDTDYNQIVRPSAILDYFQGVASEHAELLSVGYDNLKKSGLFWVLSKIRFELYSPVTVNQPVRVSTWPLTPGRAICEREFKIEDTNSGRIIAGATSKWCLLDINNHRPVSSSNIKFELESYLPRIFDINLGNISVSDGYKSKIKKEIQVNYTDLDLNMHVNNTRYADFAMRLFRADEMKGKYVQSFQINYTKECRENDILTLERFDGPDDIVIAGDAVSCRLSLKDV